MTVIETDTVNELKNRFVIFNLIICWSYIAKQKFCACSKTWPDISFSICCLLCLLWFKVRHRFVDNGGICLFRIIFIPSKGLLFSSARPHDFDGMLGTGLPVSMYTTKSPIDMCRFNVSELKEFLAFSVKDKYQLNYFICIKDFNVQTFTSLKLNLFALFIYCCQHHERKMICLIYFCYQADSGVPNTSNYSAVFLASPYYNYL